MSTTSNQEAGNAVVWMEARPSWWKFWQPKVRVLGACTLCMLKFGADGKAIIGPKPRINYMPWELCYHERKKNAQG